MLLPLLLAFITSGVWFVFSAIVDFIFSIKPQPPTPLPLPCQGTFLAKLAGIHMPFLFQSIDFCSSCHWLFTYSNGCFSEWLRRSQDRHSSVLCPQCRAVVQYVGRNHFLHNIAEVGTPFFGCIDKILTEAICMGVVYVWVFLWFKACHHPL